MNNCINPNIISDTLVWKKLVVIHPSRDSYTQSAHVVRLYRNQNGEKYYIFDHLKVDNNGMSIMDYKSEEFNLLKKHIPIKDDISIYRIDSRGRHVAVQINII